MQDRSKKKRAGSRGKGPSWDAALLMAEAEWARSRAHAPYSSFRVGAALLLADGTVVHGSNVENASYGLSVCAERTAVWNAVTSGRLDMVAIAVTAGPRTFASPCGACRQVMHEFAPELEVVWRGPGGRPVRSPLSELLPNAFDFGRAGTRVRAAGRKR